MENLQIFLADLFCKVYIIYFLFPHIGFHKYSRLISIFDLLYTPIAHEVLPVSLVDSVTAKVDDEEKDLAYSIYMWCIHHVVYFLNIHFIYFLNGFYMLFTYILEISQTHARSR